MNSKERVRMALNHQEPDRLPRNEWYWAETVPRWRKEGLGETSVHDYFGLDFFQFNIDNSFMIKKEVLEENEEFITTRDEWGCVIKNRKDYASTPMYLSYPVNSREVWENEYKPMLKNTPERYTVCPGSKRPIKELVKEGQDKELFVVMGSLLTFESTWRKVGMEELLILMASEPEYAMDLFETDTILMLEIMQGLVDSGVKIDGTFFAEDMGYKGAPLFSPNFYRRYLKGFHKQIFDFCHQQGWKNIVHCCGFFEPLIPDMIEAGADCLQALEVKAGMDVVRLKKEYGDRVSFMGGVDARSFKKSDEEFEANLVRILEQVKPGGGYLFMSDHSIPDNVSFDEYKRKMAIVEKYSWY